MTETFDETRHGRSTPAKRAPFQQRRRVRGRAGNSRSRCIGCTCFGTRGLTRTRRGDDRRSSTDACACHGRTRHSRTKLPSCLPPAAEHCSRVLKLSPGQPSLLRSIHLRSCMSAHEVRTYHSAKAFLVVLVHLLTAYDAQGSYRGDARKYVLLATCVLRTATPEDSLGGLRERHRWTSPRAFPPRSLRHLYENYVQWWLNEGTAICSECTRSAPTFSISQGARTPKFGYLTQLCSRSSQSSRITSLDAPRLLAASSTSYGSVVCAHATLCPGSDPRTSHRLRASAASFGLF